jgi:hypothetical protein
MPVTLARTISKIQSIPNSTNAQLVKEIYEYLKTNGVSERHQHNALKVMIPFANYLSSHTIFFDINSKEQVIVLFLFSFSFNSCLPLLEVGTAALESCCC